MRPNIITISREYGSGGRDIGREVAQKLGIDFYDSELVKEAAIESGLQLEVVEELEECRNATLFSTEDRLDSNTLQDKMYLAQSNAIKQFAQKGPCVIVGRAANHVLAGRDDCLHVFVYSHMDHRVRRVAERLGLTEEEARRKIEKVDQARAAYYHYYTGEEWGLARNYHISLDSGFLGVVGCAKTILNKVPPAWKPHEVRAC